MVYKHVASWLMLYAFFDCVGFDDLLWFCLSLIGVFVGVSSYNALGHECTYFGIEMGLIEYKHVTEWPYGNDFKIFG